MSLPPPTITPVTTAASTDMREIRSTEFRPKRRHWPGLLGAAVIAAGVIAAMASNYFGGHTLGTQSDGSAVNASGDAVRGAAAAPVQGGVADTGVLGDAAITAAVKTALAADPSLSAVKINVSTTQGTVLLEGPAPDVKSRQRAEVLAMAPRGVSRVDNRLALPTTAP